MNYLKLTFGFIYIVALIIFSIVVAFGRFFVPKRFLKKSVSNQIVLITGAGNDLGAALAVKFAKLKTRLVLWDINLDGLKITKSLCQKYQSEQSIWIFQVDITNRVQVIGTAERVKSDIGIVDILINNAGVFSGKSILDLDEKSIMNIVKVNIISHFWTAQAFLSDMFTRKSGHIVSIASLAGLTGCGFQDSLMQEVRYYNRPDINVLTVCLFFINTSMCPGVHSRHPFLSILDVDYVAKMIVDAILTNAKVLYIPRAVYLVIALKHLLPVNGYAYITDYLGIFMKDE